jgi:hypothetical protein
MRKILQQSVKPLSKVTMVSMFQIYQKDGEDGFRAEHLIRYPEDDDYYPHCEVYRSDITEAREWINEQMKDENLENTYERIQLANEAMASFYSNENRSKYLYNE